MIQQKLVVIGASGFGQEVLWAALAANEVETQYTVLGYCDDDPDKKGQMFSDYPVLGTPEDVNAELNEVLWFVCSIGTNNVRARVVQRVLGLGWQPATIIHPAAFVAKSAVVSAGSYIGPLASICHKSCVGHFAIVNVNSTVGHDAVLEDYTQVSPGSRVLGNCTLKEGAHVGSNAVVSQGKRVGTYATLGACSFAINDVPDGATAIGNPARVFFQQGTTGGSK